MTTTSLTPRHPDNKGKRYPAEVLTTAEMHRVLRVPSTRAPTGIRNRALIVVLWRAGLDISEALALHPADIDREACSLRVSYGKGYKARTVGMDPEAFAMIEQWLDVRERKALLDRWFVRNGIHERAPVFCTLTGAPLKAAYVRALLPRLARKAGIDTME